MEINNSSSNTSAMSDDIRLLSQAFLLAKKEFAATGKSGYNPQFKGGYAKIEQIYHAVEDALAKQNIIIWHFASVLQDNSEILFTRLIHTLSGQYVQDGRLLISEKPGNQAKGAANTYMKKYALLSLCAIATEDDDGQEEEKYIQKKATAPLLMNQFQVKELQESIKSAKNGSALYKNILNQYKFESLDLFPASLYDYVKKYITDNKE